MKEDVGLRKKILIAVHPEDRFREVHYQIHILMREWTKNGMSVEVTDRIDRRIEADVVISHLDLTVTPPDYRDFLARYPLVINGAVTDISKRRVSHNLVSLPDDFDGPVIVKSNRNYGGAPELRKFSRKGRFGRAIARGITALPWTVTGYLPTLNYRLYDHPRQVPFFVWYNRNLVVEKFLCEQRDGLYCLRQYTFFGDRELNSLAYSREPVVKSSNIIRREPVEGVPDELRAMRAALGFDFGKFDYVIKDGEVILFDVSRTPTYNPESAAGYPTRLIRLAGGIDAFWGNAGRTPLDESCSHRKRSRVIRPSLSLASIYSPDCLYVSRAHSDASRWFTNDPALQDWLTGSFLGVSGSMPQLCSVGAVSARGIELLREAGLDIRTPLYTFRREVDALETIRRLVNERACKIVFQHVYPADALPEDCYWIDRHLLTYLNNKANLGQLVPAAHTPQRTVLDPNDVFTNPPPTFPFVLKAATNQSTGAGLDVVICRRAEDLITARDHFAGCRKLVVEEFLHIEANLCLHYAVLADGSVRYLGWAQQVSDHAGKYKGNWIFADAAAPQTAIDVGHSIVSQAASLGYRGIAGLDMAVLKNGDIKVFDLNFRINGSTPAVLLADSIKRRYGRAVMRFRRGPWRGDFQSLLTTLHAALRRGDFLPLGVFDPQAAGYASAPPRVSGVILGESQQDVRKIEAELEGQGLM